MNRHADLSRPRGGVDGHDDVTGADQLCYGDARGLALDGAELA